MWTRCAAKNFSQGNEFENLILKYDKDNWYAICVKLMINAIENPIAKFITRDEHIAQTRFKHIEVERLLKIDPLPMFLKEIVHRFKNEVNTHGTNDDTNLCF